MAVAYDETRDEGERATLQRRIALCAQVAFCLDLVANLVNMLFEPLAEWFVLSQLRDWGSTVMFGLMWLLARRGTPSFRYLRVLDAAGFFSLALVICVMSRYSAPQLLTEFGSVSGPGALPLADGLSSQRLICGGILLFMLRAAVIPSPPRFTLFVTGALGGAFTGFLMVSMGSR